jgi:predicted nucleic acid-binding Zn ribbon protein
VEQAELEQLIKEHHSIRRIAAAVQVSYSTIRYWLRRYGLKSEGTAGGYGRTGARNACLNCGAAVRQNPNVYCSAHCQHVFIRRRKFENGDRASSFLKTYLLDIRERKCEVCGMTEWMGQLAPLELDHKDGDPTNNELDNLRLICPNCHAQTENYKGRNKGNGRYFRRERYALGKSY